VTHPAAGTFLAVDLGGTHMRCARVGADGGITDRVEQFTPHDGTGIVALHTLIASVASSAPCDRAVIGVPGRVDYRVGQLEYAPNLPAGWLPDLNETALTSATGLPAALANDADLAAVGEAYFGAGRRFADVAYVTISTGVGAGVVLGGLLLHGRRSLAEVGHEVIAMDRLPGKPATFEDLASGTALHRGAAAAGTAIHSQDVVAAAAKGDPAAREVWAALTAAAGTGLANVAWVFSPEVIAVGGGLGLIGEPLLGPMRHPIEVVAAELGDDAALAGAAAWHRAFRPEAAGRQTA
jgi:glucokinase